MAVPLVMIPIVIVLFMGMRKHLASTVRLGIL